MAYVVGEALKTSGGILIVKIMGIAVLGGFGHMATVMLGRGDLAPLIKIGSYAGAGALVLMEVGSFIGRIVGR